MAQSAAGTAPTHAAERTMVFRVYLQFLVAAAAILCTLLTIAHPTLLFTAVGLWAFAIVLLPYSCDRNYDLFSPWTLIVLSVLIGITLRGLYISFQLAEPKRIDFFFLSGQPPRFFLFPSLILLGGAACMTAGYMLWRRRFVIDEAKEAWCEPGLMRMIVVTGTLSLLATIAFIYVTGSIQSGKLSAKRTLITRVDIHNDTDYRGYNILRQTSRFAAFAFLVILADLMIRTGRRTILKKSLAGALLLIACLLPFYSSSRKDVVLVFVTSIAVVHYLHKRLPMKLLIAGTCAALAVIHVMTHLRRTDETGFSQCTLKSLVEPLDHLAMSRNYLGIGKTAHIVNAVPDTLTPQFGKTVWMWLLAPIPRSVWPNKPLIHAGPLIGNTIYGNRVSGVPPGIVGELYWNFYLPGVLIGCFLFGAMQRWLYDLYAPHCSASPGRVLMYIVGPMILGFQVVGTSLGMGVANMVIDMVMMHLVLLFVVRRQPAAFGAGPTVNQFRLAA